MEGTEAAHERSPLAEALAAVGDRWTLLVVEALLGGPLRFNELQEQTEGIAPNILSNRLRRLEQEGLAVAQPYSERPRRHVYELTPTGDDLATILPALGAWSARRSGSPSVRHHTCGTPLELRWWCPECATAADPGDADIWV